MQALATNSDYLIVEMNWRLCSSDASVMRALATRFFPYFVIVRIHSPFVYRTAPSPIHCSTFSHSKSSAMGLTTFRRQTRNRHLINTAANELEFKRCRLRSWQYTALTKSEWVFLFLLRFSSKQTTINSIWNWVDGLVGRTFVYFARTPSFCSNEANDPLLHINTIKPSDFLR